MKIDILEYFTTRSDIKQFYELLLCFHVLEDKGSNEKHQLQILIDLYKTTFKKVLKLDDEKDDT